MIPVDTVSVIGNVGFEFKYDIFLHCKNLCECKPHNVLPSWHNTKGKNEEKIKIIQMILSLGD
jgi:hypothetical protein